MRIISKFHDYYDNASSYGVDKSIIYQRVKKGVEKSKVKELISKHSLPKRLDFNDPLQKPFILIFCGKPYIGITKHSITFQERGTTTYNHDEIKSYLGCEINKVRFYFGETLLDWFSEHEYKDFKDLHLETGSPIIKICKPMPNGVVEITLNPNLKELQFFKVLDPFSAFQELSMYFNGVMCQSELNKPSVSNKDKITKAGFDLYTSFRNTKKKR